MENNDLRIYRLYLSNFAGIEQLEIKLGKFNVIAGDNATGKTSIMNALATVFDGGNPTELIRNGTDKAEIMIELTDGITFNKTLVRGGKATLKEKHPKYGNVSAAQTHLNKLTDAIAVNPAKLMDCKPEERVKHFLRSLPIELPKEKLEAIADGEEVGDGHPLEVIPQLRKALEARRRLKHQQLGDKRGNINELSATLPTESADVSARLSAARMELSRARDERARLEESTRQQAGERLKNLWEERRDFLESGVAELQAAIDQLHAAWKKKEMIFLDTYELEVRHANEAKEEDLGKIAEKLQPVIEELSSEVTRLEQRALEEVRIKTTRDLVARAKEQEATLDNEWKDLDSRIKQLDALSDSLTAELPIPGLTIENGDIAFDGVPFPLLNTAKKIDIFFTTGEIRFSELAFILFEGLEHFSPGNLELFKQRAMRSPKQILTTWIQDGPLTINTYEGDEEWSTEAPLTINSYEPREEAIHVGEPEATSA